MIIAVDGITQNWISRRAALRAEHFDLTYPDPEPGELDMVLRRIAEGGEPALELGCGTGRILVPLLERGVQVVGIDVSPDMLERCRARCAQRGLTVDLQIQAMQQLRLSDTFGTIFMGSCGLGVLETEDDVRATLRMVFEHLRPGGVVSFEIQTPPNPRRMQERAGVWTGGWHVAGNGSVLTMRMIYRYHPNTHVRASVMIFESYIDGRLDATELHECSNRFWTVDTVTAHLTESRFVDVIASPVFSDDPSPGSSEWLVVRARRSA